MQRTFYVYMLASRRNGTLYVGVTNDLARRVAAHKAKLIPGFTRRYGVDKLVYAEPYAVDPRSAGARTQPQALATGLEDRPHRGDQS